MEEGEGSGEESSKRKKGRKAGKGKNTNSSYIGFKQTKEVLLQFHKILHL